MDIAALAELRARAKDAAASAVTYRERAEKTPALRDFYRALAFTYDQVVRDMRLLLDTAERRTDRQDLAA